MRYIKQLYGVVLSVAIVCIAVSCEKDSVVIGGDEADLVVYGNIYTADDSAPMVSAFAVQDGQYVYVGDAEGVERFIGAHTKIIRQDDGMVMPGCTEAHAHYITDAVFKQLVYLNPASSFPEQLDQIRKYYLANKDELTQIIGFGWIEHMLTYDELHSIRDSLDAITVDIPIFISDHEMHQAWVNSTALDSANVKIYDPSADSIDQSVVAGGTFYRYNGYATGRTQDQANGYVRLKAFKGPMASRDQYLRATEAAMNKLLSLGYTNYFDAWTSYDNTDGAFKAIYDMDETQTLKVNIVGSYEIDSYKINSTNDYLPLIKEALAWRNAYRNEHFYPTNIKLFVDGCTESFTGFVKEAYPDTHGYGTCNWQNKPLFEELVKHINDNGLIVHAHAYGDAAVELAVDAFEKSSINGNKVRNGLGHVGNITDRDLKRVKQYGITIAENGVWHSASGIPVDTLVKHFGEKYQSLYPMKSFFDNGIRMASSTDDPCSVIPVPSDPFSIMEIMMTGINPWRHMSDSFVFGKQELINIEQALQAMTINGAYALGLEDSRGSIEVGKYADFLIIDKDLFSTPVDELHNTKILSTYFEGEMVYQNNEKQ